MRDLSYLAHDGLCQKRRSRGMMSCSCSAACGCRACKIKKARWPYNVKVKAANGSVLWEDDYADRDLAEESARTRSMRLDADRAELVSDGMLTVFRNGEETVF